MQMVVDETDINKYPVSQYETVLAVVRQVALGRILMAYIKLSSNSLHHNSSTTLNIIVTNFQLYLSPNGNWCCSKK